jgi:putative endonuclease
MPREWRFYVNIMSSLSRRIYTGVTDDIFRRTLRHKRREIEGLTKRYNINRLVYYKEFHYIGNAISCEKQIKDLDRAKRVALIERDNPTWDDLAEAWGKPFAPLTPVMTPTRTDPSLRS